MRKNKFALILAATILTLSTTLPARAVTISGGIAKPDGTPAPNTVNATVRDDFKGSASDEWLAVQSWTRDTGEPLIQYFSKAVQNELTGRFGSSAKSLTCEGYQIAITGYKSEYGKLALTVKSKAKLRDGQKVAALIGIPDSRRDARYIAQPAKTSKAGQYVVATLDERTLNDIAAYGKPILILIVYVK